MLKGRLARWWRADLARQGIVPTLEQVGGAAVARGCLKGQPDMTLINHVEPLTTRSIPTRRITFGYDSAPFRSLVERPPASTPANARCCLSKSSAIRVATPPTPGSAPQISTVLRKASRCDELPDLAPRHCRHALSDCGTCGRARAPPCKGIYAKVDAPANPMTVQLGWRHLAARSARR